LVDGPLHELTLVDLATTPPTFQLAPPSAPSSKPVPPAPRPPPFQNRAKAPNTSRFWGGPGVYVAALFLGFFSTAVPSATILWREPDLDAIFARGDYDGVIRALETKQAVSGAEALLWGHALHGQARRAAMLGKYELAVELRAKPDSLATHATLEALADQSLRRDAVDLLVRWPPDPGLDERLRRLALDHDAGRRHGAVEVITRRFSDAAAIARARFTAAAVDLRATSCADVQRGIGELMDLARPPSSDGARGSGNGPEHGHGRAVSAVADDARALLRESRARLAGSKCGKSGASVLARLDAELAAVSR
jgi:hypothetical protein